jgi:hypothetical protein
MPIRRLVLTIVLLAASPLLAMTDRQLIDAWAAPQLVPETRAVSGVTFKVGRMEATLTSGAVSPVVAGGETIGLFFKGKGSYTYTTSEPTEFPVVEYNARKGGGLKTEKAGAELKVRDEFETLLLLHPDPGSLVPLTDGDAASTPGTEFDRHNGVFGRDRSTSREHFGLLRRIDGAGAKAARIEMTGGKAPTIHLLDDLESHAESLLILDSPRSMRSHLYAVTISSQPTRYGRGDIAPPRWLLQHIDYTLTASEKKDVSLTITETILPLGSAQRAFRFDLNSDIYADTSDRRTLRLVRVVDESGTELPFDHGRGDLLVILPKPAPADRPFKLTFTIEGDFLIRPSGDNFWQLGTTAWFPQPPLGGQFYTVRSTVKVKKPFVPFAPGVTIRRVEEGDYNVVETRIDKPVQFAVVHAGKYAVSEEEKNGLTVRVASYAGTNKAAMRKLTKLTYDIISFYEPFLGPFPFPEFNIIEINQWGWGQAPPGTMFITQEAFNPISTIENRIFSKGINERFAHEIAHQYWGHVVKMPSGTETWISESFAEYSSALLIRKMKGEGAYKSMVATWKANANDATSASPIPYAGRLIIPSEPRDGFMKRTALVYDKGAYLLSQIHKEVGDQVFYSFLKSYQKNFEWNFGTTNNVQALLQFITKKDHAPFFDQYYWGTGMP